MRAKLVLLFGIIVAMSYTVTVHAEYYLVYPAPMTTSSCCQTTTTCCNNKTYATPKRVTSHRYVTHPKKKKYYVSHRKKSSYHIDVYYVLSAVPICSCQDDWSDEIGRCCNNRCTQARGCNSSVTQNAFVNFNGNPAPEGGYVNQSEPISDMYDRRTVDDVYPDMNIDN